MLKLRLASQRDLPAVMKLFRRVNASLLNEGNTMWNHGYPLEEDFRSDIARKTLYVASEGGRIKGAVSVSFDPLEAFFDESHDPKKLNALLDKCAGREEDSYLIIHRLMVDPMDQRKGLASNLVSYLKDLYPHRLWIFCAHPSNTKAIAFYMKKGFYNLGPYDFEYGEESRQILFCSPKGR